MQTRMMTTLLCAAALAAGTLLLAGCAEEAAPPANTTTAPAAPAPSVTAETNADGVQTAQVQVTEKGYEPASLILKPGVPARVTFVRKTDMTCGTEVLLPDYDIRKTLPLDKPVEIAFTPKKAGTYTFTCGMNMLKGTVVVQ